MPVSVIWVDRDYVTHEKKFPNDPCGAPENDLAAARRFVRLQKAKDERRDHSQIRMMRIDGGVQ